MGPAGGGGGPLVYLHCQHMCKSSGGRHLHHHRVAHEQRWDELAIRPLQATVRVVEIPFKIWMKHRFGETKERLVKYPLP